MKEIRSREICTSGCIFLFRALKYNGLKNRLMPHPALPLWFLAGWCIQYESSRRHSHGSADQEVNINDEISTRFKKAFRVH